MPFTPIGMLKFLKKVKTLNPSHAGPIVVHCRYVREGPATVWGVASGVGRARAGECEVSQQLYPKLCVATRILAPLGLWGACLRGV